MSKNNSDNSYIGKEAYIKGTSSVGLIVETNKSTTKCVLEIKGKRIVTSIDSISLKKPAKKDKSITPQIRKSTFNSNKKLTIDLHGKTIQETKLALTNLLDKALLDNVNIIEIIHGHGSGAVKKECIRFLSESSFIASYSSPTSNTGITIAYLK
jgi:DNA mismatch repair protein MutS2